MIYLTLQSPEFAFVRGVSNFSRVLEAFDGVLVARIQLSFIPAFDCWEKRTKNQEYYFPARIHRDVTEPLWACVIPNDIFYHLLCLAVRSFCASFPMSVFFFYLRVNLGNNAERRKGEKEGGERREKVVQVFSSASAGFRG